PGRRRPEVLPARLRPRPPLAGGNLLRPGPARPGGPRGGGATAAGQASATARRDPHPPLPRRLPGRPVARATDPGRPAAVGEGPAVGVGLPPHPATHTGHQGPAQRPPQPSRGGGARPGRTGRLRRGRGGPPGAVGLTAAFVPRPVAGSAAAPAADRAGPG